MAGEWRDCEWGDIAMLEYGKSLRGYENPNGHFRVYGTNGPIGWHNSALCQHPGVIVGRKGAYRGIHYSPEPFFVIDTAFFIEPKEDLDLRWAYYSLLTCDINGMDSGSAIPSTSRESFYHLPVHVPPIDEQRAIAHILGTLDDKIELNRRMNETLEAIAQALFKSWFVDPTQDGLPKDCREGKAEDLMALSRETISPSEFSDETFDHYSIPAFDESRLPRREPGRQIQSNKFLVPPDTVMLSKLNPRIPRVWLPTVSAERRSVASTEFLIAVAKPGVSPQWLYGLFSSPSFLDVFATLVTGTSGSHQRVKPEYLLAMEMAIPSRQRMREYTASTELLHDRIALNLQESRTLAALRDALLPKLISGEMRVNPPHPRGVRHPFQYEALCRYRVVPNQRASRLHPPRRAGRHTHVVNHSDQ